MGSGGLLRFLLEASEECPGETRVMDCLSVEMRITWHPIQMVGLGRRPVSSVSTSDIVMWAESRGGVVSTATLSRHVEDGLGETLGEVGGGGDGEEREVRYGGLQSTSCAVDRLGQSRGVRRHV